MTAYKLTVDDGNIEFWSNNKELVEEVRKYILTVIDAVAWRNRVERIQSTDKDTQEKENKQCQ